MDLQSLNYGPIRKEEIAEYVNYADWQLFRISLKGLSNKNKESKLKNWLNTNNYSRKAIVQVTNYVNALKRGGQIK